MIIKPTIYYHLFKKWMICLVILFNINTLSGQSFWKNNYKKADKIASKTEKALDIMELSRNLTRTLPDTIDKYRAIFNWVASNISYDIKSMDVPNNNSTKPEDVIANGNAVCEGYANLFHALCDKSNLPCQTISGWTKNFPSKINEPFPKQTTHAWNAIKINNIWYLCDVTWASGYLSEENNKFIKEFNDIYFCMPPQLFSLNHFPDDEQWFLGKILSKNYFINLPHFYTFSLANSIKNLNPENGTITFRKGKIILFTFTIDISIHNIQLRSSDSNHPVSIQFAQHKNEITFEYELDKYATYLYIYLNFQGALAYKMQ